MSVVRGSGPFMGWVGPGNTWRGLGFERWGRCLTLLVTIKLGLMKLVSVNFVNVSERK